MEDWQKALEGVVKRYYGIPGVRTPPAWVSEKTAVSVSTNAQCGDRVTIHWRADHTGNDVWIDVAGCAICRASAELLLASRQALCSDNGIGAARAMVLALTTDDTELNTETLSALEAITPWEDRDAFLSLRFVPGRQRCGTLPWEAFVDARAQGRDDSR